MNCTDALKSSVSVRFSNIYQVSGDFGTKEYFSDKEKWYTTMDGKT